MRGVPIAVAVVAAALCFVGLGSAPFIDPPEGFHAEVAREMGASGDWITPRLTGVRYFDKPPVPYWLMSVSFAVSGPTPSAARFWSALAAVGCAAVTAWVGVHLGGARVGLLAGLMVVANLGVFLYGRIVKPDLVFVFAITLAWAGLLLAYLGRRTLLLFYAGLGLAALSKDFLGALGPLAVLGLFLWLTGERPARVWFPWWGLLVAAGIALPWYLAVEARNPGFLWYTVIDNHLLNFARQRVFPDEDVPLNALEFVLVTAVAFLPWSLAAPFGVARALRRPWAAAVDRLWLLLALWALTVVGFFTVSPFKLPHYGLPAFPALALLAARVWDDALGGARHALRPRALLVPVLAVFALAAVALGASAAGVITVPRGGLAAVDVATRNLAARGEPPPASPAETWQPVVRRAAVVFALGAGLMALAAARRSLSLGVAVALATMVAFLPVAGEGMAQYARSRSTAPVIEALRSRLRPGDVVIHEGALENSASLLIALGRPVRVVDGLQSNLAFGSTFPDARDVFWDADRLRAEWTEPGRRFLVSVVRPERSVVRALPDRAVHRVVSAGGRWVYSNLAD